MSHYRVLETVINEPLKIHFWGFWGKMNLDLSEFGQTLGLNADAEAPLSQSPPRLPSLHVTYNVSGADLGITTMIYALLFFSRSLLLLMAQTTFSLLQPEGLCLLPVPI